MELTKRKLLQTVGGGATVSVGGARIVEATKPESAGVEEEYKPTRNFGIYNNSTNKESITIDIFYKGRNRLTHKFVLVGLNSDAPVQTGTSSFQGNISVPVEGVGEGLLRAETESGQNASTEILFENSNISSFSRIAVGIDPHGKLTAQHVLK